MVSCISCNFVHFPLSINMYIVALLAHQLVQSLIARVDITGGYVVSDFVSFHAHPLH